MYLFDIKNTMKKHFKTFVGSAMILSISLMGCKTTDDAAPVNSESKQITTLKNYFASTAKVNVSLIQYDEQQDVFSINNTAKISRAELQKFYLFSVAPNHVIR